MLSKLSALAFSLAAVRAEEIPKKDGVWQLNASNMAEAT
jgi:hypothetical protein